MNVEKMISDKVIPYYGYDKGWNLILYDDKNHSADEAKYMLKGLNYTDEQIEEIINLIGDGGYCVIQKDRTV